MRLLSWGRAQKAPLSSVTTEKGVYGRDATIAACTDNPVYIYNKYIRVRSLEHPVDQLNERQMKAVREFRIRQEGDGTH